MPTLLIQNGRPIEPLADIDEVRDLWIVDGCVATEPVAEGRPDEVIDATGMLVFPGFVDVHVHLREPGREEAETLETGCAAALAGGFATIVAMPNTTPTLDNPEVVEDVLTRANALDGPAVYAMPAITRERQGKELAPLGPLSQLDLVVGFTDDGAGFEDDQLCREAMEFCAEHDLVLAQHCECSDLSAGGLMHPGPAAERLGLAPYPPEAETAMIERDIRLSRETGARVHFQHVSAARSIELIRDATTSAVAVSAELTPHHLTLTDEDAARGGTNFKMNPPLRSEADRQALVQALRKGVIDIIATDHAPHTPESKAKAFAEAPCGVIGVETAAAVIWTRLVQPGLLTPLEMAHAMSRAAATAFPRLTPGGLIPGGRCDAVVFDPNAAWTVDPERFKSKSRNCPFAGWELQGRVKATIVKGRIRYRDDLR